MKSYLDYLWARDFGLSRLIFRLAFYRSMWCRIYNSKVSFYRKVAAMFSYNYCNTVNNFVGTIWVFNTKITKVNSINVSIFLFSISNSMLLEPVCCKKQQKKFLTSYWFAEKGISEGPEWFQADCISPSDSPDHPGSILYHSGFPYSTN